MHGGHWGRELIPSICGAPRQLTSPFRLKLQRRLILELLVDSFTDLWLCYKSRGLAAAPGRWPRAERQEQHKEVYIDQGYDLVEMGD